MKHERCDGNVIKVEKEKIMWFLWARLGQHADAVLGRQGDGRPVVHLLMMMMTMMHQW
jgi:hypothetical protein